MIAAKSKLKILDIEIPDIAGKPINIKHLKIYWDMTKCPDKLHCTAEV